LGLSEAQIDWFQREVVDAESAGERVVIFQHNYPYQIWENYQGAGIDKWRAIVQTRRIEGILCGHTHYWQIANDGRNAFVATRSIGDPEGGPAGYTILHLQGDDIAVTFRALNERTPIVLVIHPTDRLMATDSRHIVRAADRIAVRVWHDADIEQVRCRVDDGEWEPMTPSGTGAWSCPLHGESLSKGIHSVEALAFGVGGEVGTGRIDFVVDPTGRYTAVPCVWPIVIETAFC
jgi:hypothetical protein